MASDSQDNNKSGYFLPRNQTEAGRLDTQHAIAGAAFGYLVHPSLSALPNVQNVLDIATGTTIWLQSVRPVFPTARFVGCDISSEQFSAHKDLELFIQDVMKPFPEAHLGTYDIIHQRFLNFALSRAQWAEELPNVMTLLKPGGWAQVVELDLLLDEKECQTDALRLWRDTFQMAQDFTNQNWRPSSDLGSYLRNAGYANVQADVRPFFMGAGCNTSQELQQLGYSNWKRGINGCLKLLWGKGMLDPKRWSEEKIPEFTDRVISDFEKCGVHFNFSMAIGQRPLR